MKLKVLKNEFVCEKNNQMVFCHASSVAKFSADEYLVTWFGGPDMAELSTRGRIWAARRKNGGWQPPYVLCAHEGFAHLNPVLFQPDAESLFLYYHVGLSIREWVTWYKTSFDHGTTWGEALRVANGMPGGRGPVKNKPLILSNGVWAAPASIETHDWDCFVDLSSDRGKTWDASPLVPLDHAKFTGMGIIQPALWESAPGCVHMLTRSTAGKIYRSDSQDGGRTWCTAYPTPLPNNNSGITLTKMDSGLLVLVYNPVEKNFGARIPLCLAVSENNGQTWVDVLTLEGEGLDYSLIEKDSANWIQDSRYEFSYPSVAADGSWLAITYTWRRERIAFWEIEFD